MVVTAQQEEEALLHSCLGLLGIGHAEGARGVDLSRGMFRKPNARAFELILYHTYCVVKGKAAAKRLFKGLWPILDKDRKQAKDFHQRVQEWLKESGQLADLQGQSLAAFQRNPSGAKLVTFLCDLTDWALCAQHERMFPDELLQQHTTEAAPLLVQLSEPLLAAAEAHNQLAAERLVTLCQQGAAMQAAAEEAAAHLKEAFYSLSARLHEVQAAAAAAGLDTQQTTPAGPSIKLASILQERQQQDAQGGQVTLLAQVEGPQQQQQQQQQQEVQRLWQQLDGHLQHFQQLRQLVDGLSGSGAHPHAIDAAQLRACGSLDGAPQAAGLDVAALVEAWLYDVGSVARYVRTLAGQALDLHQQQANQARGWLPVRQQHAHAPGTGAAGSSGGSGVGQCSFFMSPLVATSDAASHATHLFAQLQLHRHCRDELLALRSTIASALEDTAAHADQLQGKLLPVIEAQWARDEALAEEAAAAALAGAGAEAATHERVAPAAAASGLFASGGMQLVPPTPLLQAAARRRNEGQAQQPLAAAAATAGEGAPDAQQQQHQQQYPHIGAAPLSLPAVPSRRGAGEALQQPVQAAAAGAGECPGITFAPHSCSAPADGAASPHLLLLAPDADGEPSPRAPSSPGSHSSGASSAALPAAELLMSTELMDLDLVDPDEQGLGGGGASDGSELDDGGVFAACTRSALRRGHQLPRRSGSGGAGGGVDASRISFARFTLTSAALAPVLAAAAAGAGAEAAASSHAPAPLAVVDEAGPAQADGGAAGAAGGQASAGAAEAVGSPLDVSPAALCDDGPGCEAQLSSAKPRRLTFAAAGAGASPSFASTSQSTPVGGEAGGDEGTSGGGRGGGADAEPTRSHAAMALLRQRFANTSSKWGPPDRD